MKLSTVGEQNAYSAGEKVGLGTGRFKATAEDSAAFTAMWSEPPFPGPTTREFKAFRAGVYAAATRARITQNGVSGVVDVGDGYGVQIEVFREGAEQPGWSGRICHGHADTNEWMEIGTFDAGLGGSWVIFPQDAERALESLVDAADPVNGPKLGLGRARLVLILAKVIAKSGVYAMTLSELTRRYVQSECSKGRF